MPNPEMPGDCPPSWGCQSRLRCKCGQICVMTCRAMHLWHFLGLMAEPPCAWLKPACRWLARGSSKPKGHPSKQTTRSPSLPWPHFLEVTTHPTASLFGHPAAVILRFDMTLTTMLLACRSSAPAAICRRNACSLQCSTAQLDNPVVSARSALAFRSLLLLADFLICHFNAMSFLVVSCCIPLVRPLQLGSFCQGI